MSHFSDYMDGVPVKISENYKKPPRIELPHSVLESPSRAQYVVDTARYCCRFEKNVLSKLKELRSAKETKKNERKHRLQLLEEAKQKKLDAIAAAEAEEKLKQLSVSDVSYPSTDEISAISPDDKVDKEQNTSLYQEENPEVVDVGSGNDLNNQLCVTETESQLNILQPIQVQSNYPQNSLLDDPDPLRDLKMNIKVVKVPQYRNIDTLTFKDFENDTSSPFDNVELKTINDMELLAQVLESQKDSSTSCQPQAVYMPDQTYNVIPSCASQAQIQEIAYLPNTYTEQPVQGQSVILSQPQNYPNGYYVPSDLCENQILNDANLYMQNYQYYTPPNTYPVMDPNYYDNQLHPQQNIGENQTPNDSAYIPHPYYFTYPQVPQYTMPMNTAYNTPTPPTPELNNVAKNASSSQNTMKSRSRSVPDIMKELDEELASAKLRANERSYNASPAPKTVEQPKSSISKKEVTKHKRKSEKLPNPYEKLTANTQAMCQKIQAMGFPLDRVARVCTLVGDNDKKVIEGLLILGELMDLGFSEGIASAALVKHEFNRDKALDELVS